jgi:hypothetical protein
MKFIHTLLVVLILAFFTGCNAGNPIGPDIPAPDRPLYEEGGQHGSGG